MKPLNQYFDHTNLKPEATESDIRELCREAVEYQFAAVCVNGCYVPQAVKELAGAGVKVAAVTGFPLGAMSAFSKAYETDEACEQGADEIDMVINIGALKDQRYDYVEDEIALMCAMAGEYGAQVKVILETCLLTDAEIIKGCRLAIRAGAAFVKTSTGFGRGGATTHAVSLMKQTVGGQIKIKAAGGVRDLKTAEELIRLGANRLGASASVSIMKEWANVNL